MIDDHELFRAGVRELLEAADFDVVGDAADGEAAVRLCAELAPDVVVMDLNMPVMSGVDATLRIRELTPNARVLMLTVSPDEADVSAAILAGACGYLVKDASAEEIVAGVRAAAIGESILSPGIASDLLERVRREEALAETPADELHLTEREVEVLRLIAEGKDNSQIAEELFISVQTVKSHVSNTLAKLQVENRIQAAVHAVRRRMI